MSRTSCTPAATVLVQGAAASTQCGVPGWTVPLDRDDCGQWTLEVHLSFVRVIAAPSQMRGLPDMVR